MGMRIVAGAATALALMAGSCGDEGVQPAPPTSVTPTDDVASTSTTTRVVLTDSWPGVTSDTIHLGIVDTDLQQLEDLGLIDNNQGDGELVVEALVDDLNARGGILGRRVEFSFELVLPINPADAEAACLRLTQDQQVFAVLGSFVGPTVGVDPCITDFGETIMIGGAPTAADLERARAPWLTTGMSAARALPAIVQLMSDEDVLEGGLAVVWAVEDEQSARDLVLPELDRLGHDVVVEAAQLADAGDRQALESEWSTLVERFRSEGVETVVLVQQSAGINGANHLALLDWEGETVIIGPAVLTSIGITAQVPREELAGVMGTMGPSGEEAYALPETQRCVDVLESAHPDITVTPADELAAGETDWSGPLLTHCTRLRLFEKIATAVGPDLTPERFRTAAEGLGEIDLPGIPFASLGPGKFDVSDTQRLAVFDPSIGEFGRAAPNGELVRVDG